MTQLYRAEPQAPFLAKCKTAINVSTSLSYFVCALHFVGLGFHAEKGLPIYALELIRRANFAYVETFTSPVEPGIEERLSNLLSLNVKKASREFIEDGRVILEQARQADVVILVPGDPMVATTHTELRARAARSGIETKLVHNSSIISAIPGETGLHNYNFGKTVTLTAGPPSIPVTVYHTLHQNLLLGTHTIILLEYDSSRNFFLAPNDALKSLLEAEKNFLYAVFVPETFAVVASRIGNADQQITGGTVSRLQTTNFGEPPHVIVIPGKLHFSEIDALKTLLKIPEEEIRDNSSTVKRLAVSMVTKYVDKTRSALADARSRDSGSTELHDLFENTELYLSDAERFLNQGQFELAILSVGYAEGLLDSLRLTGRMQINW